MPQRPPPTNPESTLGKRLWVKTKGRPTERSRGHWVFYDYVGDGRLCVMVTGLQDKDADISFFTDQNLLLKTLSPLTFEV